MRIPTPRFRISQWFWLVLVVAAFFFGRRFDATFPRFSAKPKPAVAQFLLGQGVYSNAGLTGTIVLDDGTVVGDANRGQTFQFFVGFQR